MTAWVSGEGVQGAQSNRQHGELCQETATSLKLERPLAIGLGDALELTALKKIFSTRLINPSC